MDIHPLLLLQGLYVATVSSKDAQVISFASSGRTPMHSQVRWQIQRVQCLSQGLLQQVPGYQTSKVPQIATFNVRGHPQCKVPFIGSWCLILFSGKIPSTLSWKLVLTTCTNVHKPLLTAKGGKRRVDYPVNWKLFTLRVNWKKVEYLSCVMNKLLQLIKQFETVS